MHVSGGVSVSDQRPAARVVVGGSGGVYHQRPAARMCVSGSVSVSDQRPAARVGERVRHATRSRGPRAAIRGPALRAARNYPTSPATLGSSE